MKTIKGEFFKKLDINIFYSIGLVFFAFIASYSFEKFWNQSSFDWNEVLEAGLPLFLGAVIAVFLTYFFLIRKKIRFIFNVLFLTGIFLIAFYVGLVVFNYFSIPLNIKDFFLFLFIGALVGSGIFLILSKTHNIALLLGPFLFIIYPVFYEDSNKGNSINVWEIMICLAGLMIIVSYFLFRHSFKRSEIRKTLKISYILIVLLFIAGSFFLAYLIKKNTDEKIVAITGAQQKQSQREFIIDDGSEKNNDGKKKNKTIIPSYIPSILDFSDLDNKKNSGKKSGGSESLELMVVGFYKAPEPLYLKTETFKISNDNAKVKIEPWQENSCTDVLNYSDPDFNSESYWEGQNIEVIYKSKNGAFLPTTEKVTKIDKACFNKDRGLLKTNNISSGGISKLSYKYILATNLGLDYLNNIETQGKLEKNIFTSVSDKSERYKEIKQIADNLTKNQETTYDKAKVIESYFIENYYYSFNPGIKDQESPIDDFILDSKRGYCTHFAAAMTIMLATQGIDARMVGGFYSDSFDQGLGSYVLMSTDLHAWVEVYINGYGWVTFDPTSARCNSKTDNCEKLYQIITGGNIYNPLSSTQLKYTLQDVDPKLSFDDLYAKDTNNIPAVGEIYDFNNVVNNKTTDFTPDKPKPNDKQQPPQIDKKPDNKKEPSKDTEKKAALILKILLYGMLLVVIASIIGVIMYVLYKRKQRSDYYKRLKQIRLVKSTDKKVRAILFKKYGLKFSSFLFQSSKNEFLAEIKQFDDISTLIIDFYELTNKVLYSSNYTNQDIEDIKILGNKIINQEKKNIRTSKALKK